MKVGRKIMMSLYLTPEQYDALKLISKGTGIPVQRFIRDAVDDYLQKMFVRDRDGRFKKTSGKGHETIKRLYNASA